MNLYIEDILIDHYIYYCNMADARATIFDDIDVLPTAAPLEEHSSIRGDIEIAHGYGFPRIPDFYGHIVEHATLEQTDEHHEDRWRKRHEKRIKYLSDWKATEAFAASESLGPVGRPSTPDSSTRALSKKGWDTACAIWRRDHRNRAIDAGVVPLCPHEKKVTETKLINRPM